MSLMDQGMRFAAAKLAVAAGVAVTYRRGGLSVALADAVPGNSPARSATPGQIPARVDWSERDYLIPVASLVLNGTAVRPAKGDLIEENIGGVVYRFRVAKRGDEAEWRWSDESRLVYRVHTKQEKVDA